MKERVNFFSLSDSSAFSGAICTEFSWAEIILKIDENEPGILCLPDDMVTCGGVSSRHVCLGKIWNNTTVGPCFRDSAVLCGNLSMTGLARSIISF